MLLFFTNLSLMRFQVRYVILSFVSIHNFKCDGATILPQQLELSSESDL